MDEKGSFCFSPAVCVALGRLSPGYLLHESAIMGRLLFIPVFV